MIDLKLNSNKVDNWKNFYDYSFYLKYRFVIRINQIS